VTTTRLANVFARAHEEHRLVLLTLVMPGYPTPAETDVMFDAMVEGGADIIEVEIPFSDPLADGATIQRVAYEALANGTTTADCIDFVRRARRRHADVPIIIMTYINPVLAYGLERFAGAAAEAGVDAMILVDLPPEESGPAEAAFKPHDIDLIFLAAPTSSDRRLQLIASKASGFIYCVSVTGVTGARSDLPATLPQFLERVRRCTPLPLAVGFGISRREHLEQLTGIADGAVVGSAVLSLFGSSPPAERARALREYVEQLTGRRPS
jgi:tryptophan synthase alpha chain